MGILKTVCFSGELLCCLMPKEFDHKMRWLKIVVHVQLILMTYWNNFVS